MLVCADDDVAAVLDYDALLEVVAGDGRRTSPDDLLPVDSVGSAVLDAAAAAHVYERAVEAGVGREVDRRDLTYKPGHSR